MSEITRVFNHLSIQLALIGLGVKMQALKSFKDLFKHRNSLGLHFGHRWFMHFGCAKGLSGLSHALFG
jgi:hypothetical protein